METSTLFSHCHLGSTVRTGEVSCKNRKNQKTRQDAGSDSAELLGGEHLDVVA